MELSFQTMFKRAAVGEAQCEVGVRTGQRRLCSGIGLMGRSAEPATAQPVVVAADAAVFRIERRPP